MSTMNSCVQEGVAKTGLGTGRFDSSGTQTASNRMLLGCWTNEKERVRSFGKAFCGCENEMRGGAMKRTKEQVELRQQKCDGKTKVDIVTNTCSE